MLTFYQVKILSLHFISNSRHYCLSFNFLRVGILKPFKLLKCILAGIAKELAFCAFSCYKLCNPFLFIICRSLQMCQADF